LAKTLEQYMYSQNENRPKLAMQEIPSFYASANGKLSMHALIHTISDLCSFNLGQQNWFLL